MSQTLRAERSDNIPSDVERLLRGLPEWFGIEDSLVEYVRDAGHLPTYAVRSPDDGSVVGIVLVRRHFPAAAEVHLMAVERSWHRRGVGQALMRAVENDLRIDGVRFLQVKTLSASRPDDGYEQTRQFYLAQGFTPLEEFPTLWDDANPCLLMIKSL